MLIVYFLYCFKTISDDACFICLEAQTSVEKKSICRLFIAQISHTPESQTQIAPTAKWGLEKNRAALWRWRNKGGTWALL